MRKHDGDKEDWSVKNGEVKRRCSLFRGSIHVRE